MAINEKKYMAADIANFLVFLMSGTCEDLTNMKLNKLLYYAQGHYLQKYDRPLFEDKIEAWTHGPVVKEVYRAYKRYSDQCISTYDPARIDLIDDDVKSYLVDIAREYGRYTASTLRNMTHRPKTPWSMVEEGGEITPQMMREYFLKKEKEIKPLEIDYAEDDFIGRRDIDGIIVLPEDWQDAEV